MDQIFLQINRTLRQFTDNLIRSSSDLKDEEKEARGEKTRTTGAVDGFDEGALSNTMSDDFLGELGAGPGGGSLTTFEEIEEEDKDKEDDEGKEEESAGGSGDEGEEERGENESGQGVGDQGSGIGEEDPSDIADIIQTARFRTEVHFEDKDGFIIMETTRNILFVDDKGSDTEAEVEDTQEGAEVESRGSEVGGSAAAECLDAMIRSDNPVAVRRAKAILGVFGVRALRLCRNFGTTLVLASSNQDAAGLLGLEDEQDELRRLRAFYLASQKICFFGEEVLRSLACADFNTPVHIFAHAYDHALGGDGFASLKSPAVLNTYHACLSGKEGHYFPDGYAESSPVRYFASSVEAYFQGSLTSGPGGPRAFYFTKEDLYDYDRDMFSYLDCLFSEI